MGTLKNKFYGNNLKSFGILLFSIVIIRFFLAFPQPALANSFSDSLAWLITNKTGKERIELLNISAENIMINNPEKALSFAVTAEKFARSEKQQILLSDALKLKADAYFYLNKMDSSLTAYVESAKTDELSKTPRPDSILRRIGDAGYVLLQQGKFNQSIEYLNHALQLSRTQKDTAQIATNLSNLGISHKMLGNYEKAVGYFLQTLELDKLTGNNADMSTNYNSIGMLYLSWEKPEAALEFLNLAIEYDLKSGNESKLSIRYSNMSKIFMTLNEPQTAIEYLEKALEIDRRQNQPVKIGTRLQGLGLCYMAMKNYPKAIAKMQEATEIFRRAGAEYKLAGIKIQLGKIYVGQNDLIAAEKVFKEGMEIAKKHNLRAEQAEASRELYHLNKKSDDFYQALFYFEELKMHQDSMFSEQSAKQINEFEVKYESEKKEHENRILQKENELRRKKQQQATGAIIALFLITISLLWAFILKRKSLLQSRVLFAKESELTRLKMENFERKNQHLQELLFAEEEIKKLQIRSLEQKNQELTSATLLIANKNDVFIKLKRLAEAIKVQTNNDSTEIVKEIITEIDRQTDIENQWEQFRRRFESVHKSFFDKLHKNNASLTQNDLQMCAYIKLNMATKEIARLMNIAPESVNTNRYRLRKKLNLNEGQTLDEFIHSL
jgi:tetratricopeptide (TPR) repeat protein